MMCVVDLHDDHLLGYVTYNNRNACIGIIGML